MQRCESSVASAGGWDYVLAKNPTPSHESGTIRVTNPMHLKGRQRILVTVVILNEPQ